MALRRILGRTATFVVDSLGGVPFTLPDGSRARVTFRCRHIGPGYESVFARRFAAALQPDWTVVDIGAHVGLYAIMAARRVRSVIAFEPSHRNARFLRVNLVLSGLRNVEIRERVVTDRVGTVTFHDHVGTRDAPSMMSSLLRQQDCVPVDLPATTLDAENLTPQAVKIDVEGAEAAVLDGAVETLRRARPLVFLEVHHARLVALGRSVDDLRTAFDGAGYAVEIVSAHDAFDDERIEHWVCRPL